MTPPILGQLGHLFMTGSVAGLSLIPGAGGVPSIGSSEGAGMRCVLNAARPGRPQSELATAHAAGGEYMLGTRREGGATVSGDTNVVQQIHEAGGDLKLCNLTKQVRALFELVRMHKILDIFETRAEAVAAFQGKS